MGWEKWIWNWPLLVKQFYEKLSSLELKHCTCTLSSKNPWNRWLHKWFCNKLFSTFFSFFPIINDDLPISRKKFVAWIFQFHEKTKKSRITFLPSSDTLYPKNHSSVTWVVSCPSTPLSVLWPYTVTRQFFPHNYSLYFYKFKTNKVKMI